MLQYKIPQDVGVADKIIGPLTLRQLIMIAIGGGISYVLYAITGKLYELNILEYIIIALPLMIAVAAAFIKINGIPLIQFVLLGLEFNIKPKRRLWDHRGISNIVSPNLLDTTQTTQKTTTQEGKTRKDVNLDELSKILDSGGFEHLDKIEHEDIDEVEDDNLMLQAFFGKKDSKDGNMWMRNAKDKEAYNRKLDMLSKLPKTEVKALKEMKEQIAKINEEEQSQKNKTIQTKKDVVKALPIVKPTPQPKPQPTMAPKKLEEVVPKTEVVIPIKPKVVAYAPAPASKPKVEPIVKENIQKPKVETPRVQNTEVILPKKKKRRRNKKPKIAQPIRPETHVDNTQKRQPAKFRPQQPNKPQQTEVINNQPKAMAEKPTSNNQGGEIHFEELQKGEIELNLD